MTSSYNGWPASPDPAAIGINRRWEPVPGHDFPGGIKSGPVEVVFTYLVRQLHARVEPIEEYPAGDEWGYHYKQSANSPSLLSCHSSGTAIDYNATQHPNRVRNTWSDKQVTEIRKILAECGGVIRWLRDTSGTPDEMHFEIKGTATEVAAAAKQLTNQEMFTVSQFDQIMQAIGEVKAGVLVDIAEGRTEADDTPANLPDMVKELRVNQRTVITEQNRVRKEAGLPPLHIVVGYNADGTPRYDS